MKVMVIGGGGREHAIIKKLRESKEITELYALPGNGGIAEDAVCVNIGATDIAAQVKFATENKIDYAVVAPTTAVPRRGGRAYKGGRTLFRTLIKGGDY